MEYKYNLTIRPFGTGTYPAPNFLRWEKDKTPYGVLVYSERIPIETASHFSLAHITEVSGLDGKSFYWGETDYVWKIDVKQSSRFITYIMARQFDRGKQVNSIPLTTSEFLSRVKNGQFIIIEEQAE